MDTSSTTAQCLARLYGEKFGGKPSGRYRIAGKQLRELMGRKRLYPDDIQTLSRELLELGFVLIDMDSFYVILSANSFVNYRRVNAEHLSAMK
ncbi:hypothetical protein ACFE33_12430 [Falsihalocynthiibacter sp. SS001]|uniref:hypothetical protein n=1 Tax=Falsihalocynthiibacter sp. SS001 TaxID=3349698 RepID=UPI0036D3770D